MNGVIVNKIKMDAQKTFDAILHHINTSVNSEHLELCKEMARDHFQVRTKDDNRYAELILAIQHREMVPTHDCGAHDQPDWTLQTR